MDFSELGLNPPILRAVADDGCEAPTPIQALAIPHIIAGRDLLACARARSGKTAAFVMALVDRLALRARQPGPRSVRVLVLTPTRELALQLAASFVSHARHVQLQRALVISAGTLDRQPNVASQGADVLVTTPRAMLDLLSRDAPPLGDLETFVLDEADRLGESRSAAEIEAIVSKLPVRRQTLIFTGAITVGVRALAQSLLTSPMHATASPPVTPQALGQAVYFVEKAKKRELLSSILSDPAIERVLLFARTRHGANRVAQHLSDCGIRAASIVGDVLASARDATLEAFDSRELRVLVVTDVAIRGVEIQAPAFVINYDLPNAADTYIERVRRCSQAGHSGQVLSFCEAHERSSLRNIERSICGTIAVVSPPAPLDYADDGATLAGQ